MAWVPVACPQCAATLPRQALWRTVNCAHCGALVTRTESIVRREDFRQALNRAVHADVGPGQIMSCGGQRFRVLHSLGADDFFGGQTALTESLLVERTGGLPMRAVLKRSSMPAAADTYQREAANLLALHALQGQGSAYFSQLIAAVIARGPIHDPIHDPIQDHQAGLVLRYPSGYWGSLALLHERFPQGLDGRHVVWIWRRVLAMLTYLHAQHWCHQLVRPEHLLVHPQHHGILFCSWSRAQGRASIAAKVQDLKDSATVMWILLQGTRAGQAPEVHDALDAHDAFDGSQAAPILQLIAQVRGDDAFCRTHLAPGIDQQLQIAAAKAYGPPHFLPLVL